MSEEKALEKFEALLKRLKDNDPLYDLRVEFGGLLMIHINDFTPEQRARYDELKKILKNHPI